VTQKKVHTAQVRYTVGTCFARRHAEMTAHRPKTLVRALVGLLSVGGVLAPVLVATTTSAQTTDPKFRKVSAPNVFYPVTGGRRVKDLQTYSKKHTATDIVTACGAAAWASHPGTAWVSTKPSWGGKYMVTISSGRPGIISRYAYLTRVYVANGQIIQSGQMLGSIGSKPGAKYCGLQFSIAGSRGSRWPRSTCSAPATRPGAAATRRTPRAWSAR
jgi:hypothetical protein